ncbi:MULTISPECIES: PadR family transcriptional regulator [unclassified Sphingomonas]|uniref:PadR family transcriptional regulator n=1 Tax=unclassified Sphingomonas TaxID=196159 RepID=UPI00226AD1DD|nr:MULTISPECIES: PadR family transcriptional regulator [unclassified Sphingomonas]
MRFGMGHEGWGRGERGQHRHGGHHGGHHGTHGRGCGPRGGGGRDGEEYMAWKSGAGPRGRGPRMFDGGELRLVLLKLIADETRHGYELIRAIETLTGGAYAPSPGVVYPTLSMLDEMGLTAQQQSDDAKKRFAITDEGRAHLEQNAELVEALFARLAAVGEHRERTNGAPLRRAMGNLRMAVQNRLEQGNITEDTLHDVAALIDEVAQKIERLK